MVVARLPEVSPGFLDSCLVEGDPVQEARVRRSKRRALLFSITFQILLVTGLVLFPLFTKGENITSGMIVFPSVPYPRGTTHPHQGSKPLNPRPINHTTCHFCQPDHIPTGIVTHDNSRTPVTDDSDVSEIPGLPEGKPDGVRIGILGIDDHGSRRDTDIIVPPHAPRRISEPVIAAKLVRRVEPVYPPLAVPMRREGRVELHAIIAADGTIQSLEVVKGDPLFIQSALIAVHEWRYQPTILDGQPVEVDTYITVIYTLTH